MKRPMILAGVICIATLLLPACAPEPEPEAAPEPVFDQAAEEAAIRKVLEQSLAAYNGHDAKAYAALLTENFENWEGDRKGRAATEKMLTERFERQKDRQAKLLDEIGIIFVTPDVAIFKMRGEFTGMLDADGKPLPPLKRLIAHVYVKKNSRWLRAAWFGRPIEESPST